MPDIFFKSKEPKEPKKPTEQELREEMAASLVVAEHGIIKAHNNKMLPQPRIKSRL